MTAEELMQKYGMQPHIENGAFAEQHYPHTGPDRAASGSIYYYVAPGESTQFHRIDCDEYWCFVQGAPLVLFLVHPDGRAEGIRLGTDPGCEPMFYLKKGVIFASRSLAEGPEGSFLTCITVPRFTYEGFQMFGTEDLVRQFPSLKELLERYE